MSSAKGAPQLCHRLPRRKRRPGNRVVPTTSTAEICLCRQHEARIPLPHGDPPGTRPHRRDVGPGGLLGVTPRESRHMPPVDDGDVLPLLAELGVLQAYRGPLARLLTRVDVDADFVHYAALVPRLRELVRHAASLHMPGFPQFATYAAALDELGALLSRCHLVRIDDDDIPRSQAFRERYPLFRSLTASVATQHREPVARLRCLLIATALQRPRRVRSPAVEKAADQIYFATRAADDRPEMFARLPSLTSSQFPIAVFAAEARALLHGSPMRRTQRDFVRLMVSLAEVCLEQAISSGEDHPEANPTPPRLVPWVDSEPDAEDVDEPEVLTTPDSVVGDGDSPRSHLFVRERRSRPGVSSEGLDAAARRSRYWAQAMSRALPWDRAGLSPTELKGLVCQLRGDCRIGQGEVNPNSALAGLILATGLDFTSILELRFGQDIDPGTGIYERRPVGPADGAVPDPADAALYRPTGSSLPLPLPPLVVQLLPSRAEGTVSEWLASRQHPGSEEFCRYLGGLPQSHVVRVTPSRLSRALGYTLHQRYDDLGLTFLLAGRPSQLPPVELYYATYSADRLVRAYVDTTRSMLGEPTA